MTNRPHKATVIRIDHSAAFLPADGPTRLPRAPKRKRPQKFWDAFEGKALFYDCFWTIDKHRVLLSAPPPLNLEGHYRNAGYVAQPSGQPLQADFAPSRSTMLIELADVPAGTEAIEITFAGIKFNLAIQQNEAHHFQGRNLITTMNKNNPLDWIKQWLDWHATLHGADAALIFDNGSGAYAIEELEQTLASVPGIKVVCVVNWPYSYGPYDPGVIFHRHWANFLQMASLQVLHRRFAATANAILNCDIDELVGRESGADVFTRAKTSPLGLLTLKGQWVEGAVASQDEGLPHHLRYRYRHKSRLKSICANKWALDPSRNWLDPIEIKPNVHRIYGIDKSAGRNAPNLPFWHFKSINTNWKVDRRKNEDVVSRWHVRLTGFDREVRDYLERKSAGA